VINFVDQTNDANHYTTPPTIHRNEQPQKADNVLLFFIRVWQSFAQKQAVRGQ